MKENKHTRHRAVDIRPPKCKAIIERTALVFLPRRLKPNTRVHAARTCAHIRSDEVVKHDAHPLCRCRAAAGERCGSCLCHIAITWCDCGRKVGCVGTPVVDEDVFEERGLDVGVVECGVGVGDGECGQDKE